MYELMVVTSGRSEGENLISRVTKLIKDGEGTQVKVVNLGKKTLAYPIKKNTEATYFLINFEAPPDLISTLTGKLRLEQEEVLRYMIVKVKKGKQKTVSVKHTLQIEEKAEVPKVKVAVKAANKKVSKSAKTGQKAVKSKKQKTVRKKK